MFGLDAILSQARNNRRGGGGRQIQHGNDGGRRGDIGGQQGWGGDMDI